MFVIALYLTVLGLWAVDIAPTHWVTATAVCVWPVFLVVTAINAVLFPADLEVATRPGDLMTPPASGHGKHRHRARS